MSWELNENTTADQNPDYWYENECEIYTYANKVNQKNKKGLILLIVSDVVDWNYYEIYHDPKTNHFNKKNIVSSFW